MKATIKYSNSAKQAQAIEVDSRQSARQVLVDNPDIVSVRLTNLRLGETEWEFTRDARYARKQCAPLDEHGIAAIPWSNCD